MKEPIYIFAGTRTPFIRMGSYFADQPAADLGRHVVKQLIEETGIDAGALDEVIMGCVCQPADSANIARVIALRAGVPEHVPAATVHRNCASGMEAISTAAERIAAGRGELYMVGGVENMTRTPLLYSESAVRKFAALAKAKGTVAKLKALSKFRPKDLSPVISLKLGLTDPVVGMGMGQTAELLAREFDITRGMQDAFAVDSHLKALKAEQHLAAQITAYPAHGKALTDDNGIRPDSSTEKLAKLRPVFEKNTGTVTAGNSSQITDGAVALLVGTESAGMKHGLTPLASLTGYAYTGCDPKRMGLGPVHAIRLANERTGLSLNDADMVEVNEAFAAQVLACCALLEKEGNELPAEKLNPYGGSVALGHPVGATGARLVLNAIHFLKNTDSNRALASLCVGGGQGAAMWIENFKG